ncbi:MAG: hypothetical protein HQ463_06200 [Bacteroidetes bacterium]|nr:hypothetical protein [Bacteroidota bacterium]
MQNKPLIIVWIVGIVLHMLSAWFSTGYFHVDEHFQLVEYSNYLIGNVSASELPWEFGATMRPTFQVYIFYWGIKFFNLFGLHNPFILSAIFRLISASLALNATHFLGKTLFKTDTKQYFIFITTSLFLWFMPYQHVRFSSENWSAIAIIFSIGFLLKDKYALAGIFSALSFAFRFQSAFFIVGILLWLIFIRKNDWKYCIQYVLFGLLVFGFSIVTDYFFYSKWVCTSYIYFYQNLIVGKASEFGTDPFYYYFIKIIEQGIAPYGILILIAFGFGVYKNPKSIIVWTSLPFLLGHMAVGHKELRFLFPLIYFIPIYLVWFYEHFKVQIKNKLGLKVLFYLLIIINFIALPIASFKSSNPRLPLLQWLSKNDTGKVLCLKNNPYLDNFWYQFYITNPLCKQWTIVENTDSIKGGSILIVPSYKLENEMGFTKIHTQVPSYLEKVNQIHWIERSNFWSVYKKD